MVSHIHEEMESKAVSWFACSRLCDLADNIAERIGEERRTFNGELIASMTDSHRDDFRTVFLHAAKHEDSQHIEELEQAGFNTRDLILSLLEAHGAQKSRDKRNEELGTIESPSEKDFEIACTIVAQKLWAHRAIEWSRRGGSIGMAVAPAFMAIKNPLLLLVIEGISGGASLQWNSMMHSIAEKKLGPAWRTVVNYVDANPTMATESKLSEFRIPYKSSAPINPNDIYVLELPTDEFGPNPSEMDMFVPDNSFPEPPVWEEDLIHPGEQDTFRPDDDDFLDHPSDKNDNDVDPDFSHSGNGYFGVAQRFHMNVNQ